MPSNQRRASRTLSETTALGGLLEAPLCCNCKKTTVLQGPFPCLALWELATAGSVGTAKESYCHCYIPSPLAFLFTCILLTLDLYCIWRVHFCTSKENKDLESKVGKNKSGAWLVQLVRRTVGTTCALAVVFECYRLSTFISYLARFLVFFPSLFSLLARKCIREISTNSPCNKFFSFIL